MASPQASKQFTKRNSSRFPDQLLREADGLELLRSAAAGSGIDVPRVIAVDRETLTIPLISTSQCAPAQWQVLGRGLAAIHAKPQSSFGLAQDNFIGLNPQPNGWCDSWSDFFLRQRLEFQVGLITDQRLRRDFSNRLQQAAARLRALLDSEPIRPSLLHGDLWSGNVLCGADGRVWLIDPACYYGDSDVDLAMTEMFGVFAADFYSTYRAARPESTNWRVKKTIYNLYHFLNHLNLFGDDYLSGCEAGFETLESL